MSLLDKVVACFKERRQNCVPVSEERRGGMGTRLKAASARVDSALDDCNQTLTMSRSDFQALLRREEMKDVKK